MSVVITPPFKLSSLWTLINPQYAGGKSISTSDTSPSDVKFSSDGTKMFVVGTASDSVHEFTLSTPWNVQTASTVQSFSVASQTGTPNCLAFRPDGTQMYIGDNNPPSSAIYSYVLPTPWSLTSASFLSSVNVGTFVNTLAGLEFRPTGFGLYVVGTNTLSQSSIFEYVLSTIWDITTSSHVQSVLVASGSNGLAIKSDGTRFFTIQDTTTDNAREYHMATPWDVSTTSYVRNFNTGAFESQSRGITVKPDGARMFIIGAATKTVLQFDL